MRGDVADICRCDVALIFAGMHRDALRTRGDTGIYRFYEIWDVAAPRISQRGDFVDVDT